MKAHLLVTGGLGFIGSNFIQYMLGKYPDVMITNLDCMTYAGNPASLQELATDRRYHWIKGDISDEVLVQDIVHDGIDMIVHFAAESHVDRSIDQPGHFLRTNIGGTMVLLEAARKYNISRYIQISTDEVYGSLGAHGKFTEESPLAPNSPYSASKASADLFVRAYHQTYGVPTIVTRCSNNYGPRQHPEKWIPLVITRALQDQPIPVYGTGLNVRDWLYVEDHCRAIEAVLLQGIPGEIYNIGGNNERTNLEVAHLILSELGKPESLLHFTADRPGHDHRYAIDAQKAMRNLNWQPQWDWERGLKNTIQWYCNRQDWWKPLLISGGVEPYR